jgi:hypothetical protein
LQFVREQAKRGADMDVGFEIGPESLQAGDPCRR